MGQNWLGAYFCIVREIIIIFILAKGSRKNKYETEIANGLKRKTYLLSGPFFIENFCLFCLKDVTGSQIKAVEGKWRHHTKLHQLFYCKEDT